MACTPGNHTHLGVDTVIKLYDVNGPVGTFVASIATVGNYIGASPTTPGYPSIATAVGNNRINQACSSPNSFQFPEVMCGGIPQQPELIPLLV